jgi:hypothetical protein
LPGGSPFTNQDGESYNSDPKLRHPELRARFNSMLALRGANPSVRFAQPSSPAAQKLGHIEIFPRCESALPNLVSQLLV